MHDYGEKQGGYCQENGNHLVMAHHVSEEPDSQRKRTGNLSHHVKREEDERGLKILLEIVIGICHLMAAGIRCQPATP